MINIEQGDPYLMGGLCGHFLTRGKMKSCFLMTERIDNISNFFLLAVAIVDSPNEG